MNTRGKQATEFVPGSGDGAAPSIPAPYVITGFLIDVMLPSYERQSSPRTSRKHRTAIALADELVAELALYGYEIMKVRR